MRLIWGVASAAVLLGLAGCTGTSGASAPQAGSSGTSATAASSTPTASATPGSTASTSAAAAMALHLAISAQQMGAGWTSQPLPDGDQVQGQVTLDLCGASFPSESLRIARHQIKLLSATDAISNEAVIYRPGGAQQARSELLHAAATCPTGPVQDAVAGVGMATFKVRSLSPDAHWLPGTVALDITVTNSGGQTLEEVAIYQFHGDAMSAVYGAVTNGHADAAELHAATTAATLLSSPAS